MYNILLYIHTQAYPSEYVYVIDVLEKDRPEPETEKRGIGHQ